MNRTLLILAAIVPLVAVACSQVGQVPSEAENVDLLLSNRSEFEAAIAAAYAEPRILRIERRERGRLHVLPTNADCDRVRSIASFMRTHGVLYVSTTPSGEITDFTVFDQVVPGHYESRMLTHRTAMLPGREDIVTSTDTSVLHDPTGRVGWRPLGDGWFLRAASFPVGTGRRSGSDKLPPLSPCGY